MEFILPQFVCYNLYFHQEKRLFLNDINLTKQADICSDQIVCIRLLPHDGRQKQHSNNKLISWILRTNTASLYNEFSQKTLFEED